MNKRALADENENVISKEHLKKWITFKNAIKSLQINKNPYIMDEQSDITDLIIKAINKCKHHPGN